MTNVAQLTSLEDWADAVAMLPALGPLPERIVLVPNERVAHALRRSLLERGQGAVLVGTRFVRLVELARGIVADAGQVMSINDAELTPALVRAAFASVALERFAAEELLALSGWDEAFAKAIRELEAAALSPAALLAHEDAQVRDVGKVFEHVSRDGRRHSESTVLLRAAEVLRAQPAVYRATPKLAVVTGFETACELALLRALPGTTWALWTVRPTRAEHDARIARALGPDFALVGRDAVPSHNPTTLGTLSARLFQRKLVPLADVPNDETVEVVTYAGVHEEVEAAVGWVVEQVLERGIAFQDIALLAPSPDAYASLLCARLKALPWTEQTQLPVFVERGLPLSERADGARMLALVRALRCGLHREELSAILPFLRCSDGASRVRGLSRSVQLLNVVAWVGGERSHLDKGLGLTDAWERAIDRQEQSPASSGGLPDAQEKLRAGRVEDLVALRASVAGLSSLLSAAVSGRALAALWSELREFVRSCVRLPPEAPPAWALLDEAVSSYVSANPEQPAGAAALDWLEAELSGRNVRSGRYGEPALYVGSLAGVRGLSFRAVRVLGLVEGALPSAVREDAVLADVARRSLSPDLPTSRTRAHLQLTSLDDTVRSAREQLVLSAPRVSIDGSARQPAAVLLDVMRALGVSADALEATLEQRADKARAQERRLRDVLAITDSAQLSRIAAGERDGRGAHEVVSLAALRRIQCREQPGALDGLLRGLVPQARLPGLSPENPISATRLSTLLSCPHRYLFEQVLRWRQPEALLPTQALSPTTFGSLLHDVAEVFWTEHGTRFGAREGELSHYAALLRALGEEWFAALRASYPFANDEVARAQLEAFCDQLTKLLEYDWNGGAPRELVAVERGFGYDAPCELETEAGPLYVRGNIDRLDREGDALLVRDLKTGRSKARKADEEPSVDVDLQLGLYARVAQRLSQAWNTPPTVGVAYVYLRTGELERRWAGRDYDALHQASGKWLAAAVQTLSEGAFVRSPNREDCKYCAFQAVCEPEHGRTQAVLEDKRVPTRLAVLKMGAGE